MTYSQILSAAIIGAGNIAGGYDSKKYIHDNGIYTHAGAFKTLGNIRLKSVLDKNFHVAKAFTRKWGGVAILSLDTILKQYHDIISVCTPDATHYEIVKALLLNQCCKTICIEKPATKKPQQMIELMMLAKKNRVHIVVNFQRHFDKSHVKLAHSLKRELHSNILSVQALYMKGLDHNGVTMIDTLRFLIGNPKAVLALRRVFNHQIKDYSYDFVLYYPQFIVTIRTSDSEHGFYNYHIFEIDILLNDRRISIVDNSRLVREFPLCNLGYSGVKGLNDAKPKLTPTQYCTSMKYVADYLFRITTGLQKHNQNTLNSSFQTMQIIGAVKKSYKSGLKKIRLTELYEKS